MKIIHHKKKVSYSLLDAAGVWYQYGCHRNSRVREGDDAGRVSPFCYIYWG